MKKIFIIGIVFLLLVSFVSASNTTTCSGFWGSISCVLWGNPSLRENVVGEAFGSRGNLVGMAATNNISENPQGCADPKCDKLLPNYSPVNYKNQLKGGQKDPKGSFVYYEDINGNNIRVKQDKCGANDCLKVYNSQTEKWEENKEIDVDSTGKKGKFPTTYKELIEGKLNVDGKVTSGYLTKHFADGGESKVVEEIMRGKFKDQVGDEVYKKYEPFIDWRNGKNWDDFNKKELNGKTGKVKINDEVNGIKTITATDIDDKINGDNYVYKNEIIAGYLSKDQTDDKSKGKVTIGKEVAYVANPDDIKGLLEESDKKEILGYANQNDVGKAEVIPQVSLEKDERGRIITTAFQSVSTGVIGDGMGTQTIIDPNGMKTKWEGDYYRGKDKSDGLCSGKINCFIPDKGTIIDKSGRSFLADADTTGTGKDQKLEKIELYNSASGRYDGVINPDGSSVIAQRGVIGKNDDKTDKIGYTGNMIVTKPGETKGEIAIRDEKDGKWKVGDKEVNIKDQADSIYSHTTGYIGISQSVVESIYAIENSIKSYPALSQLLFKDIGGGWKGLEDWQHTEERIFAPMLGSNWFPSAVCEGKSALMGDSLFGNTDINADGKQFIKTTSGLYQAVASVQGERSEDTSALLCYANPDTEAKQKYICDEDQVCKEDGFCYESEDAEKPLEGYFYKITWAVSAPQDEKSTPLVDENGIAVNFNVIVKDDKGIVISRLYNKDGNNQAPIELKNGAKDRDTIVHYSPKLLKEVCLVWGDGKMYTQSIGSSGAKTTGAIIAGVPVVGPVVGGLVGGIASTPAGEVGDVCNDIVVSTVGQAGWEASSKSSGSGSTTTVSSGKVSKNTKW